MCFECNVNEYVPADASDRLTELTNEVENLTAELEALEAKRDKTRNALENVKAQLATETPELETLSVEVGSRQNRLNAGNLDDLLANLESNRDGLKKQIAAAQAEVGKKC